jgi:hypothetical protein
MITNINDYLPKL